MKQLRELSELFADNIITTQEYEKQKEIVLKELNTLYADGWLFILQIKRKRN